MGILVECDGRTCAGVSECCKFRAGREVGSVFVATAGNANPELVAGRTREGGMATLNETLLGHSIRVTGPLLSRHRGPCCQAASAPRSHGPSEREQRERCRQIRPPPPRVKGLTLPPPLRCPLTTTFSELRLPSCVRKVPSVRSPVCGRGRASWSVGRPVTAP